MKYWLLKNEAADYSIDDFKRDKKTEWTGVRNYQARNFMRDQMNKGDLGFYYHSNAEPSGIAGVMKIVNGPIADDTQFDKNSKYYDEKATKENPRWMCREVQFVKKFKHVLSIGEIREIKACKDMFILQKGSRLSITPVSKKEWDHLLKICEEL